MYSWSFCTRNRDGIDMWGVLKVAQSLYRLERKLKLLVIVGLRSYSSWPGQEPMKIEEVILAEVVSVPVDPGWGIPLVRDDQTHQPNWVMIFGGAVRPGGKLVLVDKQCDVMSSLTHAGLIAHPVREGGEQADESDVWFDEMDGGQG